MGSGRDGVPTVRRRGIVGHPGQWLRQWLAATLCVLVALPGVTASATSAQAAVLGDDYPPGLVGSNDGWGFVPKNCTSFVAWRLRNANGVDFTNWYGQPSGQKWGNAGLWNSAASRAGITVNSTPAVGAVAWFAAGVGGAGSAGHVAWVAEVNGANVTIEEYNWDKAVLSYNRRTIPASRASGYIHVKDLSAASGGNPFGALDAVSSPEAGVVWVQGWAADPDQKNGPIAVHVYWNDRASGIWANKSRPDVAAAYPGYGSNLGYGDRVVVDLAGDLNICTYAINVGQGTTNPQLGCKRVRVDDPNPSGHLDSVSGLAGQRATVRGWAADPNLKNGPLKVDVYANDKFVKTLSANVYRDDVQKALPGYGDSLGFDAVVDLPMDGSVRLCAYAINAGPGWVNSPLGCKTVVVPREIAGPTPSVQGTAQVGSQLTTSPGTWHPAPVSLAYQWLRDGVAISGAIQSTYALVVADAGKLVSVRVTGSKAGYTTVSKTSAAVTVQAATPPPSSSPSPQPSVSSSPQPSVSPSPQPSASPSPSPSVKPSPTPTPSPAPELKKLTSTPVPKVSGTVKVGKKLTASPGTWKPSGVVFSYQWFRGSVAIQGATARTYTLQGADKGKTVKVQVTGAKSGYVSVAKMSKATKKVATGTLTKGTPKISGTAKVGKVLTAKPGSWKPAAVVTLNYQWYRNGKKISGATTATYSVVSKDKGKKLTVKVTGKAVGYATASKTSAKTKKVK